MKGDLAAPAGRQSRRRQSAAFLALWLAACAGQAVDPDRRGAQPPPRPVTGDPASRSPAEPASADAAGGDAEPSAPSRPAPAVDASPITVALVGDLMLGSTYPDASGGALPPGDGAELLRSVTAPLFTADLAFGNLEAPLFDGGGAPHCSPGGIAERHHGQAGATSCWAFRMPVRYGALLRDAGIDAVSLANNHIDDFGEPGRTSTVAELDRVGVAHSGPRGTVAHLQVRGRPVDFIALAPYPGLNDMRDRDAAEALVEASVKAGALVVVSFHGGAEGTLARHVPDGRETFFTEDRGAVKEFSRAMVRAGAALVFGHGPHVLRGMEVQDGRLVAYSLGTFASYGGIRVDGVLGVTMVLAVSLAPDGTFLGGRIHAVRQRPPGGPRFDPERAAVKAVRELSQADFGPTAPAVADDGAIAPP